MVVLAVLHGLDEMMHGLDGTMHGLDGMMHGLNAVMDGRDKNQGGKVLSSARVVMHGKSVQRAAVTHDALVQKRRS